MKKGLALLSVAILVILSFISGSWYSSKTSRGSTEKGRKVLYYADPMHPAYKSDKPGIAPDCGMQLEPVYADSEAAEEGSGGKKDQMLPGTVRITPEKQRVIGVRSVEVNRKPVLHPLRILGRVTPDEALTYRINAATEVWVRRISPATTGSLVKKDETLMSYYTGGFLASSGAYLYALDTRDRHRKTTDVSAAQATNLDNQMRQAVGTLINMGVSESQIREMEKTRKVSEFVDVRSPSSGFILNRAVSLGQFVPVGGEMYSIVDLSRVWILAETYEKEGKLLSPGMKVKVTHPQTKQIFQARVSDIYPRFDPQTRTMKVRLEADNPGFALRPDMFVDLEILLTLPAALTVSADAVIDSGLKKVLYIDKGNGYFEPRRVETGWRLGNMIEITGGLMQGEKVVSSGTFLVDSESRMRVAGMGIRSDYTRDPVCDMYLDEMKADMSGRKIDYEGQTYFFCSDECQKEFGKNPKKHAGKKIPDKAAAGQRGAHDIRESGMGRTSKREGSDSHSRADSGNEMDMKSRRLSDKTATDQPETLLPPPPGMETRSGGTDIHDERDYGLPSSKAERSNAGPEMGHPQK